MRTQPIPGTLLLLALGLIGCTNETFTPRDDPGAPPTGLMAVGTPTGFVASACHASGGWVRYDLAWDAGSSSESALIAEQSSNDTTSANVIINVAASDGAYLMDGHRTISLPHNYFYFIRFFDGSNYSAWVPISPNPLSYSTCSV